jgi:hypothetical protein
MGKTRRQNKAVREAVLGFNKLKHATNPISPKDIVMALNSDENIEEKYGGEVTLRSVNAILRHGARRIRVPS